MPYITPPTIPPEMAERLIRFPRHSEWFSLVGGALSELGYFSEWEQVTGVSREEAADAAKLIYQSFQEGSFMIGAIMAYVGDTPPAGMLPCDGSVYDHDEYPQLWEQMPLALKTIDAFSTPDLRGQIIIAAGEIVTSTPNVILEPHQVYGEAQVGLTIDTMPAHSHTNTPHEHTYQRPVTGVDLEGAGIPDITAVGNPPLPFQTNATSISINDTGGGEAHNNMPPVYALHYGIVAR